MIIDFTTGAVKQLSRIGGQPVWSWSGPPAPEGISSISEPGYIGRVQIGCEIPILLQCVDVMETPDDPVYLPWAQIWRDGSPPTLIESVEMAADARGVEDGVFRASVFLGDSYASGRHLIVFKWNDSDGINHLISAAFHILPGGDADGTIIGMYYSNRPDAAYVIMQCDSGRLIRKANPR